MLFSSIMFLAVLFGCSNEQFNDENIAFTVVHTESTNEFKSYTIEIVNNTGFDLTHLRLNLTYPIKTSNGSKDNPFSVEGKADNLTRQINLKTGETIVFTIFAPINEVFSNTELLDFENPNVNLIGFVKDGNEEIPFGISGGLNVLENY